MRKPIWKIAAAGGILILAPVLILRAQLQNDQQLPVSHPECVFFGSQHSHFVKPAAHTVSALTQAVTAQLASAPAASRAYIAQTTGNSSLIDKYLFQAMSDAGVQPADPTTDWEFVRRVTLDLTGRIPTPQAVLSFVNSTDPNKRANLIGALLASPQWVDKWTMFYGDLFQNNSANTQIRRYGEGVQAFYAYIKASLAADKPYDQIARELIAAQGANSYTTGEINWMAGGVVTGGPVQDVWDQQTANIATTFLGISHVNCLLCHNGKGHLDTLSLWASQTTRYQAWGLASFVSHTQTANTRVNAATVVPYYWSVTDNTKYKTDYPLNTTTGNRPARQPVGTVSAVPPAYLFGGQTPAAGQNYRVALGQFVTSDFQFARAAVNYVWEQFFEVGLVSPSDQFDPARLDPSNPPPAPWTLQASNPDLLNALAQAFIDNKYDVKWLMRQIANSRAYQLSSRYNGAWNDAWQSLYARKFVRRLWAEEIHDSVAEASNIIPSYTMPVYGTTSWAMQFPEPLNTPDGANGNINNLLDAFLRGNRDDQPRREDGGISQALNLMNDSFVMNRVSSTKTTANASSLLVSNIGLPNDQLVNTLFLAVLSRYPNATEMQIALQNLSNPSTRNQEAENLLWSLFNKVDFTFNY